MLKIAAVTGGRADWGLLSPVLKTLSENEAFALDLIVTGQHLMVSSDSLDAIRADGFEDFTAIDMGLTEDDSASAVTRAAGRALAGFAGHFETARPDLLLVLGDRYEILAAVLAATLHTIPVAHICGGDITEGAMDDAFRHAITKMAHLHFVTNEEAKARLIRMGENPERVHCAGSPGLDHIHSLDEMGRDEFFQAIGFEPRRKNILATFHPVTLEANSVEQCRAMLDALAEMGPDAGIILTGSNADPEGQTLTKIARDFAAQTPHSHFVMSLGTRLYLNALRHMDAMVGNSSSALYEAPSFGLPAVNIGTRQTGRLKAASVIDCPPDKAAIAAAIQKALAMPKKKVENPYGDGHAAEKIAAVLKTVKNTETLGRKVFYDG